MSVIRVDFLPEFYLGDDAVLMTLDGAGVVEVKDALEAALVSGASRLSRDGSSHEFHIERDAAAIDLAPGRVVWQLDSAKAAEIVGCLAALAAPREGGRTAGHFYVDLETPAETLIVSRDEYVDVVYPWVAPT